MVNDMGNEKLCVYCAHSNEHRKQAEKIRCTRYSSWVLPNGTACNEYQESCRHILQREPFSKLLSRGDVVASAALTHGHKGGADNG